MTSSSASFTCTFSDYTNTFCTCTLTPPACINVYNASLKSIHTDTYETPGAFIIDLQLNSSLQTREIQNVLMTCVPSFSSSLSTSFISGAYSSSDNVTDVMSMSGCNVNTSLLISNVYIRKNVYTGNIMRVTPAYRFTNLETITTTN